MKKPSRLILLFATLGFVVGMLIAGYIRYIGLFQGNVIDIFVVACPSALLCIPFSEMTQTLVGYYSIWFLICALNAATYALITAFIIGLTRKGP